MAELGKNEKETREAKKNTRGQHDIDNQANLSDLPEIPPLPDITDTSYMSARFQAPPRFSATHFVGESDRDTDSMGRSTEDPSHTSEELDSTENATDSVHEESIGSKRMVRIERRAFRNFQMPEDLYEAATAHFLSSYRNPLEEEVEWKSPKVRVPIIWWILFSLSLLTSIVLLVVLLFFPELVDIPYLHSLSRPLLMLMVFAIVSVGLTITFIRLKKPVFWNKFHTIYTLTCFLWGFGGVSGLSSLVVTAWVDLTYTASEVRDIVSLILPISLWGGFMCIVPPVVGARLLPVWERHAPLIRLGVNGTFWGSYAGIVTALIAPYISREHPALSFVTLALMVLPTAGAFTAGIVVSLPVRWPISFTAYLNYILGILLVSFGIAVIMSYMLVNNTRIGGTIVLTALILAMAVIGLWAILGISQAPDPLLRSNLEHLQTWVDADVISPDEHEFMCNEFSISAWGLTALRRGAFLAARDYYRAVMRLAFLDFGDEAAQDLCNVIRITRRKLEAAGIPPCTDFESFSEVPIYPDLLS